MNCMSRHIKAANVTKRNELSFHAQNALCLRRFTFRDTKQEGLAFKKITAMNTLLINACSFFFSQTSSDRIQKTAFFFFQ